MKAHNWGTEQLRIPDFQDEPTRELRQYLKDYFVLKLPDSFYYQEHVCVCFIVLLVVWGSLIVSKSILQKQFWVFRTQSSSSGHERLGVIPNFINCFLLFEGCYYCFLIIYIYYTRAIDKNQISGKARGFLLLYVWIPCFEGAFFAALGSLCIVPGALMRSVTKEGGFNFKRFMPSSFQINAIALGLPLVVTVGMVTCGIVSGIHYANAWTAWKELDQALRLQDARSSLSQAQLDTALAIRIKLVEAYYWVSVGFFILLLVSSAFLVTYSAGVFLLARSLRSQLDEIRELFGSPKPSAAPSLNVEEMERRVSSWNTLRAQENEVAAAEEEMSLPNPLALDRAAQSRFFPSIEAPSAQVLNADSPEQRSKALREALSTITRFSICFNLCVAIFVGNLCFICSGIYESSLKSSSDFTKFHEIWHLIPIWNTAILGTIGFLIVFTRTFQTFFEGSQSLSITRFCSTLSRIRTIRVSRPVARRTTHHRASPYELQAGQLVVLGQDTSQEQDEIGKQASISNLSYPGW